MTQLITNDHEIKEYHRNRLYKLSLKSLGEIPQLDKPTYEQKCWFVRRIKKTYTAWETSIEHRPWIFRWQYFVLGDYE